MIAGGTAILSTLMIAKIAPWMRAFTVRYYFAILPFWALLLIKAWKCIIEKFIPGKRRFCLLVVLVAVCIAGCGALKKHCFLYNDGDASRNAIDCFSHENVFLIHDNAFENHEFAPYCQNAERVYSATAINDNVINEMMQMEAGEYCFLVLDCRSITRAAAEAYFDEKAGLSFEYTDRAWYSLDNISEYWIYKVKRI